MNYFRHSLFLLLLVSAGSYGQSSQQLACQQNAQNICNSPSFQLTPGAGNGLPGGLNVSNPSTNPQNGNAGCHLSNAPGPSWLVITIGSNGMLGFSFGANGSQFPQAGFYDWALWQYTPNTCANIFNNTLPPVACNYNGSSTGGTGMGTVPAGGSATNFQPSIPVTAGQQFILLFSNWSSVTSSVTIQNNGTAALACSPLIIPSAVRCPNQPAVITATWANSQNLTNVSYTITPTMPMNINTYTVQTSPTFIVSSPATQVYTVIATGFDNASNSVITASNVFALNISPTVTMDIVASPNTAAGNEGNVCHGTAATFTALASGTNYSLSPPASSGVPPMVSAFPVISTPTLGQSGTGNYTLSTTLFSGCTATGAVKVNVAPNHTIDVITNTNVCLYAPLTLTASLATATAYFWTGPNSYSSASANPTISNMQLAAAGAYTVSANINFNGITCPRRAATQVNVVQTHPVSASASPNDTLCQWQNLNLVANTNGSANFFWTGPNAFNVTSQSAFVSNSIPANAGVYTITAMFSNGQISCPRVNTINIEVIATAFPTVSIPNNVCQNSNATFSVSALENPVGFLWSGPNNFSSTLTSVTVGNIQPAAAGQYYAYALFKIGGAKTCSVQVNAQMNVVPINNIGIIPPEPVCRPNNAYFYCQALSAAGYTWTGPNNFSSPQQNLVLFQPQTNASGIYTVQVSFGNTALTCYNSNTVSLTVNPILPFSLTKVDKPYCYNENIHIEGPSGANSYTWSSSTTFTSNSKDLNLTNVQAQQSGIYTLSVSLGPCVTSDNITLEILDRIVPDEDVLPKSLTLCKNSAPVSFVANALKGSKNYAFTWSPANDLSSPTGSYIIANPKSTTIFNVTAHDIACPNYSVTHSFTIDVKSAPEPSWNLERIAGCAPFCKYYDSKINSSPNVIVFYEFVNEANGKSKQLQTDSLNNLSYCITEAGTYKVRVISTILTEEELTCTETFEQPINIKVFPNPEADMIWTPEMPTLSENEVSFSYFSKVPVELLSWEFAGCTGDTLLVPNPQRKYEKAGMFPVMLVTKTEEGCYDTLVKYIDIKEDFNVFIPNVFTPNDDNMNDVFMVKGSSVNPKGFSMEIFDRWGNSVFFSKDPATGWDGSIKGGQAAASDVYIYKIKLASEGKEGNKEFMGHVTLMR